MASKVGNTFPKKLAKHIFENGSPEVKKHLNFVKVMRTRPELIDEFNALKSSLQRKYPDDPSAYQLEKAVFYDRINKIIIN